MGSRVLTADLIEAFKDRVQQSNEVWLASAWVTASECLDHLMASGCVVRALVGTHGNATDPSCLRAMIDELDPDSLRIVGDDGPLFHPKLYLFRHTNGDAVAWIGSPNFTGAGFASNREILLDFDDAGVTSQLESWFDREWQALRNQNVEDELSAYEGRRRSMGVGSLYAVVEAGASSATSISPSQRFQFEPAPNRGPRNYSGEVVVSYTNGTKKKRRYMAATDALCIVLDELQTNDGTFLDRCVGDRAFQERHRDGAPSLLLARSSERGRMAEVRKTAGELGPTQQRNARGVNPRKLLEGDWLVSRDVAPRRVWSMIRAACRNGKVALVGEDEKCGL